MNYTSLGIALTRKCTASCKMCCFNSSPNCTEQIDFDSAKKLIQSTINVMSIKNIGFTGGEAFLEYENMKELITVASSINKTTTVVTNGFWATSFSITRGILKDLQMLGLNQITVSYDEFHAAFVQKKNIINILEVCRELNLTCEVQCILSTNESFEALKGLGKSLLDKKVTFIPLYPVGEAKRLPLSYFDKKGKCNGLYCRKGGMLLCDFNGDIFPCCSPYVYTTSLKIGNIYDSNPDFEEIFRRIKTNPFLYVLRNYGFDYYIDLANKLEISIPSEVISACELCSIIFNKKNMTKMKYEIEKKYLVDNLVFMKGE